jgi:hypothetical protein
MIEKVAFSGIHLGDLSHILCAQRELENIEVLFHAFLFHGLGIKTMQRWICQRRTTCATLLLYLAHCIPLHIIGPYQ